MHSIKGYCMYVYLCINLLLGLAINTRQKPNLLLSSTTAVCWLGSPLLLVLSTLTPHTAMSYRAPGTTDCTTTTGCDTRVYTTTMGTPKRVTWRAPMRFCPVLLNSPATWYCKRVLAFVTWIGLGVGSKSICITYVHTGWRKH